MGAKKEIDNSLIDSYIELKEISRNVERRIEGMIAEGLFIHNPDFYYEVKSLKGEKGLDKLGELLSEGVNSIIFSEYFKIKRELLVLSLNVEGLGI